MSNSRLTRSGQTRGETRKAFSSAIRDNIAKFFQGTFLESFDALVIEDGGAVKMTLEQAGGGDLTMWFSDGYTTLDCTPILNVTLTEGADAEHPKRNYVYILKTTQTLAVSDSGWPVAEHIKVGFFFIQTDVEVAAKGALVNQNINDHVASTSGAGTGQGHLTHIAERLRRGGAIWLDGCEGVATQDGNDLWVSIAAGLVSQAHPHTFAALDSDTAGAGDPILVVNDPDGAYRSINNLNEIEKLSDGTAIGNNKYIKLDLWAVSNKSGTHSPMMLDTPSGQYNTASDADIDVEGYADFSIPVEFSLESTTGFLVASFVCKHTATAMEIVTTIDQRGRTPATAGGAGTGGGDVTLATVIADNAIAVGDGGAKGIQGRTASIADNGVMSVPGIGDGGLNNFDLKVGNTLTPDYGMIQLGNACIGRTSYKVGNIDLDGTILIRNIGGPVTSEIEFMVAESTGNTCRFALAKSAIGNVTYFPRSGIFAGPAPANTDFVKISFWQADPYQIFHNLTCDTAGSGSDLGVQNDLEVEGIIYADNIVESTPAAGVTVDGRDVGADGAVLDAHVADTSDPHGSTMSVSVKFIVPLVHADGQDLALEVHDVFQDRTVYVRNPDGTFQADLNVERNVILGGTVNGRDIAADGAILDTAVTADAILTDDALVRGKGGALGAQTSVVSLTDAGVMGGITQLNVDNLRFDGNTISTTGGTELNITPMTGDSLLTNVTGTVTGDIGAWSIRNYGWNASMVDTRTGVVFFQAYETGGVGVAGTAISGAMKVGTETNWGAFGTRDSYMALFTTLAGIPVERMRMTSEGRMCLRTIDPFQFRTNHAFFVLHREANHCNFVVAVESNTTSNRGTCMFARARGTEATKLAVQNGSPPDTLGAFLVAGYDGAAYQYGAQFLFVVDGTVSSGTVPVAMVFETGAPTRVERLRIQSDGNILVDTDGQMQYRDAAIYTYSSVDGQLDHVADGEIELTAPIVDLNAASIFAASLISGTDQADAGAAAGELYVDTNDDNTVKRGV